MSFTFYTYFCVRRVLSVNDIEKILIFLTVVLAEFHCYMSVSSGLVFLNIYVGVFAMNDEAPLALSKH